MESNLQAGLTALIGLVAGWLIKQFLGVKAPLAEPVEPDHKPIAPKPEPKPADPFDGLPGLPGHPVLNLVLPFLTKLLLGGLIMDNADDSIRPHGPAKLDAGDEAAIAALAWGLRENAAAKDQILKLLK